MGVVEKEQWMIEKMVQASALYLLQRIGSCYFAGLGWRLNCGGQFRCLSINFDISLLREITSSNSGELGQPFLSGSQAE